MLGEFLLLIAVSLFSFAFYKWATLSNDYFEKRNVKHLKPRFLVGNTGDQFLNKYTAPGFMQKLYQAFPNESIYGMFDFRAPQYVIRDPELFKQITIKDFDHFEDHRGFFDASSDNLWGNALNFMKGEKWRQMRATLSPAFTGSKMRQMFELVSECADEMVNHFLKRVENGEQINLEMKDFFSRYANDVIATCAFGIKINSFAEPENQFFLDGKKVTNFSSFKIAFRLFTLMKLPEIARLLKIRLTDKSIEKSFRDMIIDTMRVRKEKNIFRPDMINMMMQVREGTLSSGEKKTDQNEGFATVEEFDMGKAVTKNAWSDDEIVANCFIFFVAGFDPSSTLLTFTAYELAINPAIQQKLYEECVEMNKKLGGKRCNYDALQMMKYLDQVICEALRKWPPAVQMDRLCVKDYTIDSGDGNQIQVGKGSYLTFPTYAVHHDPKYFSEPEIFDPERFNEENKNKIIPGTYTPFGMGPRNCIGSRFALMEVKAILYYLLLHFSFEPNQKTQIPVQLKKFPFKLMPENGMHLELKPRKK